MGSSKFHLSSHSSLLRSSGEGRGWSLPASHLPLTILEGQCHREYVMSLAVIQTNDVHSVVGFGQCKFRHHEGSMPGVC